MPRRRYLNFTTPVGIELAAVARSGPSSFLIHECGWRPDLRGWNHAGVDSPFWRFYHNPRPGCFVRHRGARLALTPDRAVLIPAYTVFDCVQSAPVSAHLWIHFSITRAGGVAFEAPVIIPVDAVLRPVIAAAIALHEPAASGLRVQRIYHVAAALLHLGFSRLDTRLTPAHPEKLEELLALIHRAPHGDLSNPFLAARCGMSVEQFIRWFRKHTGRTPAVYVSEARVRLAREALALTDKSIEQIADEFGFPNRSYFSRVFARQVGCGPAEFRLRQREKRGR